MDEKQHLLNKLNEEILQIYKDENLLDFEPNEGVQFNKKNSLHYFTEITRKKRKNTFKINDFKIYDDLLKKNVDVKYLIANLYLHKSYIWNFITGYLELRGEKTYTYYPSYHDTRYFTFCDLLYQAIYNYWDGIGDLLAIYFTPKLNDRNIYFENVITKIPNQFEKSSNYLWLMNFLNTDYRDLNEKRIQIVHYFSYSTDIREVWQKNMNDETQIFDLQKEIETLPDYFKKHLNLMIKGFEMATQLIDEIE